MINTNDLKNINNIPSIKNQCNTNKTDILTVKNELDKSVNTKYSTVNGTKEFECKDGYIDNIYIEGETLVNLCYFPNSPNYSDVRFFQTFDNRISGYDTYTIFIPMIKGSGKDIGFEVYDQQGPCSHGFGVSSNKGMLVVNIPKECRIATIHCFKSDFTEEQLKQICETSMIIPGDYTNKRISYFEGIKSVGQGDKIEVLTYNGTDIFKSKADDLVGKWYMYSGTGLTDHPTRNSKFFTAVSGDVFTFSNIKAGDVHVALYKNNVYVGGVLCYAGNTYSISQSIYNFDEMRVGYNIYESKDVIIVKNSKHDKKQILTTARSLPNGTKDLIYDLGDKSYKLKKCEEVVLNGGENWGWAVTNTNTIVFAIPKPSDMKYINASTPIMVTDKFKVVSDAENAVDVEKIWSNNSNVFIGVTKTKLTTQDLAGFKVWLKANPVTVVYELATPQPIELPNYSPRTFEGKTTFLLNTGVVQGECNFEVTNSLGSELEVLKDKESNLEEVFKAHEHDYQKHKMTAYDGRPLETIEDSNDSRFNNGICFLYQYKGDNLPKPGSWNIINLSNGSTLQTQLSINTSNELYMRTRLRDNWTPWQKVATSSTFNLLEQQVSELEIQALERGL